MEMLQLRYFYESAIHESHSKTAEKYMVPVSSVSASIKRLETELGIALFERTGNRIFLTEKGKQFLLTVEHILKELDRGVSNVIATETNEEKITVLVRSMRLTVAKRAQQFQTRYPLASFKLDLHCAERAITDYDIVVTTPTEELVGYESFTFGRYALRVEALSSDSLCQRKISLSQLRERAFVTPNSHNGLFKTFSQACERQGFSPKIAFECNDYLCYNRYLSSGTALGITMNNALNSASSDTQYLEITDLSETITTNVYYKPESYHGATRHFIDYLRTPASLL